MLDDLRHAVRLLAKNPGFGAVAVLTLALGIGANTAVFSVIDATILRRLPYPAADRLMQPRLGVRSAPGRTDPMPWSYPKFEMLRADGRNFDAVAGFAALNMTLTEAHGEPERIRTGLVSAPYFSILGARPEHGRFFYAGEDEVPGRNPVAVISHGLWERRYGGRDVIGRSINVNDVPLTIVGVAPREFEDLSGRVDAWAPMMMAPRLAYPEILQEAQSHWFDAVARRRNGVTPARAAADVALIGKRIGTAFPTSGNVWSADALPLAEARSDPAFRKGLSVLLGGAGFVLLIACVNVANLLLARAASRRREIGVRLALGIGRIRLVRQLFVESLVLAGVAGGVALVFAFWTTRALSAISPDEASRLPLPSTALPGLAGIAIDVRILAFTFVLSVVAAVIFGFAPAVVASRAAVTELLKGTAEVPASGLARRLRGRTLLAAAEVAIALVLLVGAGLMMRSFERLTRVDPGFQASNVLALRIQPSSNAWDRRSAAELHRRLIEKIASLPGVRAVGLDKCAPLSSACADSIVSQVDGVAIAGAHPGIGVHFASPDYFRALGIPLFRGRVFTPDDSGTASHVAIVNRETAQRLWPGRDPIGREIVVQVSYFFKGRDVTVPARVVGVVGNVRYGRPDEAPAMDVFVPDLQAATPGTFIFVRTDDGRSVRLDDIRGAIQDVDPTIPLFDVRSMDERAADAMASARYAALLLGSFSLLALALAVIGVYAVMASLTRERTREIAIRVALGASAGDVRRRVTLEALRLAGAGAVYGIAASLALTHVLSPFLFEVSARDPLIYASVAAALIVAAMVASWIPARRASRVDPVEALRYQ